MDIARILGREQVAVDRALIDKFVAGRRCAVTGAGGSIGSELCRRLREHGASLILAIDNHEPSLYAITDELPDMAARLGDIRDRVRIYSLMAAFRPEIVFHAAAYKHVPGLELDWREAIKTNVGGSKIVFDAARDHGATAVLISTDKAADPVSVLGATKRIAEAIFAPGPNSLSVRFGNVFGSSGSVIPKFEKQIAAGGPVTITHRDMTRYFMSVTEACDLVLAAAAHGQFPIYVLKTGEPISIVDIAVRMIGAKWIRVEFTGMRPGERLHERLIGDYEVGINTGIESLVGVACAAKITDAQIRDVMVSGRDALMRTVNRFHVKQKQEGE